MDLSKDSKDIYTVDRDSYAEYMNENRKESNDLLSSFIKLLLVILLLVLGYFFYKIVKADLSFSEVFNKQELQSTFELFNAKTQYLEKENYVETLAKTIPTDFVKPRETVVLSVSKKYVEPLVVKEDVNLTVIEKAKIVEEVVLVDTSISKKIQVTKEVIVEVPKEKEEKPIIKELTETMPSTIKIKKSGSPENILSESYLDRIVEELNSI